MDKRILTEVHIADLHFGAFDPAKQYEILMNQFYEKIRYLEYDILSINGDIFDHKFMANSDAVMWAMKFIDVLVTDSMMKNADMVILEGTESHDAGQLKLFYSYRENCLNAVYVAESIQFVYLHGKKVLLIPEKYGIPEEVYRHFLYESGYYDGVYMHGTYKNSVHGANTPTINTPGAPVFGPEHFMYCRGPIIAGHVHVPGCFDKHVYYCGSPLRYKFGEEQEKGFIILMHNLDTCQYYLHFEPIISYRYDTINMDGYIGRDPKELIERVSYLQSQGIQNLRLQFTRSDDNLFSVLDSYYRNTGSVSFLRPDDRIDKIVKAQAEQSSKYNEYQYIFDKELSPEQQLTRYINQKKGFQYITTDELRQVLNGFA